MGVHLNFIYVNRIFPYKPSILGCPQFLEPPIDDSLIQKRADFPAQAAGVRPGWAVDWRGSPVGMAGGSAAKST